MTASDVAAGDATLQRLANETAATIVIGVERQSDRAAFNEARAYRPGTPVMSYSKQHLLPPFELRFTPGKTLLRLQTASGPWGVAICKDMDFTPLSRKYGQAGVGLMLVPAWDFDMDRAWHGHMAVMRGVENGFSVLRSAKHGYLTASDNRGRILAERRSDAAPLATLAAHVPTGHTWTVFQLLGDWFAWVAIALAGWAAIRLVSGSRGL
jgi:apolipoprotein N-acyltransferase